MTKHRLALVLGSLLLAAPVLMGQQPQLVPAIPPTPAAPAANAAPKAHTREEAVALINLNKLASDSATTPAQLDAAITQFITNYPNSEFLASVNVLGLRYYLTPGHTDYSKALVYGEAALKANPQELDALSIMGSVIPQNVHDTDLDRAQRLQEAANDDQQLLTTAQAVLAAGSYQGKPVTDQNGIKNMIVGVEADAYSSLAVIADMNKDYAGEVADYQKAIPLDSAANQAQDYYFTARAQVSLKQFTDALASLDAADKLDSGNAQVQSAVATERKLVQEFQSGH